MRTNVRTKQPVFILFEDLPEMMTCSQAAMFLQVSDNTISKYIREGKLRAFRAPDGRSYRIRKSDLLEFIEHNTSSILT